VLSVSLSPPQVLARFYIYHDFATIPLPIQSTMQQKKSQGIKMIEANQRECSTGVNFSMPPSFLDPVSNLDYPNNFCF
jgi:hypothetical protein